MVAEVQEGASEFWEGFAALATFAAVLVALFGPGLRDWWRRPKLRIAKQDVLDFAAWQDDLLGDIAPEGSSLISLGIWNRGKEQANDVQVFLTLGQEIELGQAFPSKSDAFAYNRRAELAPVPFLHREGGAWTEQYSVGMPAKFVRPLQLMKVRGDRFRITTNARREGKALGDGKYLVILTLVSSSTTTIRYAGVLAIRRAEAEWLRRPKRLWRYKPSISGPPRNLKRLTRRYRDPFAHNEGS